MPAEWTDAEIESLSAYIDGQLEESDRAALDARLANDADLRQELAVMRQTVALLRDLPTIRAPRAFTLTPEMVGQTAFPAAAHAELRVLPATKQARPARRVWWMPAASAAAVVLLAGVFVVMQTNMSNQTPPTGAVQQGVAVVLTPTTIINFSELNTVVQESVTESEALGVASATNDDADQSDGTIDEQDDTVPDGAVGEQAPREAILVLTTEVLNQGTMTQVGMPAPIAPPIQGQNQVVLTQVEISAPLLQAVEAQTGEPRFAPSPTAMPTTTMELMDAMVLPLATQMLLPTQMPMLTASPDPKLYPPPAGDPVPITTGMGGGNEAANTDAVAGMDGINTNPQASGFTVATVSPLQGTVIAQYNAADLENAQAAAETPAAASSVMQDAPSDAMRSPKDPIWIRWFNVLSAWVEQMLGE